MYELLFTAKIKVTRNIYMKARLAIALASDIWELNPTVDILLSGLLPRADNQFPGALQRTDFIADVNQWAHQLNNCLASLCTRVPQLHYVGHPTFAQNGAIQRDLLSRDGLHLSFRGTSTVVTDIETAVSTLDAATRTIPTTSIWDISTTHTTNPEPTESKPETDRTPYLLPLSFTIGSSVVFMRPSSIFLKLLFLRS